jgi:sugar phosphate isomerase/epimerase
VTRTIYVSSTSFESRDLESILRLCGEARIEGLELSLVDGPFRPSALSRYPTRFIVHNYFPPADPPFVLNLASQDGDSLARARAHCRAAIDLSQRLGGEVYAAHAGFTADLSPRDLGDPQRQSAVPEESIAPRSSAYATLVESARELSSYAGMRRVRFLIENNVLAADAGERGSQLLLMVDADELAQLVEDVADPAFGILIDVGHLKVSAKTCGFDRETFLDRLAPHIGAFHLSDNDGAVDSHAAFGDEAWFLQRLAEHPAATVTIELSARPLEAIAAVRDTVARWL